MEQQQEPQFSREESANRISRLIAKISRVHCNCVNERLQPLGLTNLTSTHLINILRRPGMSQNELACLLSMSKVMVSKTLKQLEQEGLITRIPDQEDKRLVHLYVTPRGEELAQESIAIQREITCLAASTLTQEECICVENKLNEVLEHLSSLMEKNR